MHYADILGTIKIFKENNGALKKVIPFKDNAAETVQNINNRDTILIEAISEVHTIERTINPLTDIMEENDRIVTRATVIENSGLSRSWVKVESAGNKIRMGDYVKTVPIAGFAKTWNNITNKETTAIQNFGQ